MTFKAALAIIRQGQWVTPRRLKVYPLIYLVIFLITTSGVVFLSNGALDTKGDLLGGDFVPFWSAANMIWQGRPEAAYDPVQLGDVFKDLMGVDGGNYAWFYPPTALLIVAPLAALPYLPALTTWLAVTFCGYLSLLWSMLPRREALIPILAFPPVFINLGHGQNAFLSSALLGWGLVLLPRWPWLAGMLLGALVYKPHLGLLIPLALLAANNWRAMGGATLAALSMIAASYMIYGEAVWVAYLENYQLPRRVLEEGILPWPKMISVFATARMLGATVPVAWALQGMVGLVVAVVVWQVWRRPGHYWVKAALLPAAALLAPPLVWDYDAVSLSVTLAALVTVGLRDGFLDWEVSVLAWAWMSPLFWRPVTVATYIPLGLMTLMLLIWLVARRSGHEPPFVLADGSHSGVKGRNTNVAG